jgi:predicted nucleic acid-binding Zn ribbon protein
MPIYNYTHITPSPDCEDPFELMVEMDQTIDSCPKCGGPVKKMIARFAVGRNVLSTSNIKEKGFQRWRRKEKGVYERD